MTEYPEVYDVVDGAVVVNIHAQPGAGRSAVTGRHGAAIKVKVAAPPIEGRANQAIVELLAKEIGVKPAQVVLVSGETSRDKRFRLEGLDPDGFETVLARILPESQRGRR